MKVIFLGSSHGVPEPNRKRSCILLEIQGNRYLIDAGMDPTEELIRRGISPEVLRAVFITHMHGDHIDGLIPLVDLCSWFYRKSELKTYLPDMRMVPVLRELLKVEGVEMSALLSFDEVREGEIYRDECMAVTAVRTGHTKTSFAYLVEAEGKKLLFTGDMKGGTGPVDDYARFASRDDLDLAVAECAHFNAMLYEQTLRQHPPKLFCINHYSWAYVESCYHLKETMKGAANIVLATDGLEIEV